MLPLCPNQLSQCQDLTPSQILHPPPPPRCRSGSHSFSYSFPLPSFILLSFAWIYSHLVLYENFCTWGYIPDASVERDVLHFHLFLCHFVSPIGIFFKEDIDMANRYMKRCSTSLIIYKENVHQTTMRYHLISFKMAFIFKKAWQVFVKLRRKRESPWIAGENVNWCSHLGKQYEDSSKKIRNRTVICSRYPTSGYLSKII